MRRFRLTAAASLLVLSGCSSGAGVIERVDTTAAETETSNAPETPNASALAAATDGARTLGDPVLPGHGNGGYDVTHYDLTIDATEIAVSGALAARIDIALSVAEPLRSFSLDFVGFEIASVTLDGEPARHERSDAKLIIEPNEPIVGEHRLTVDYSGVPTPVNDESAPGTLGWMSGTSGTYLVAEPGGLMALIPCNDHPSDPASFSFTIAAVAGTTVATSGVTTPDSPTPGFTALDATTTDARTHDHTTPDPTTLDPTTPEPAPRDAASAMTWSSNLTSAVPTYAVQIAIGEYDVVRSEVDLGERTLPIRHVVPRRMPDELRDTLSITDAQVR
ncbi:MAG: M1 family metallopeptidase, partial [Actinobacteria bacterium]|nr:M1 family metallopeptidase [Actinomycetota bacterium]